jgi:hypothetical protein
MALNTAIYSGLKNNRSIPYPGPDGQETHYYFSAGSPAAAAPELGLITIMSQPSIGYVHAIDKFNCSIASTDTSENEIVIQYLSGDYSIEYWRFSIQMGLLIGNPQYTYPLILGDQSWTIALSFNAKSGSFPREYFSFRHRLVNVNGAR